MAIKSLGLAVLLLMATGAAAGDGSPAPLLKDMKWIEKPSGGDLASVYPRQARREDLPGHAVTACRVNAAGRLEACRTMAEGPAGYGFGEAALKLMPRFQMSPTTASGASVAGGVVDIPIVFSTDGRRPTPVGYQPGTPAVLVTTDAGGATPSYACPSEADPARKCRSHKFTWASSPSIRQAETAAILRGAGQTQGTFMMECGAAADGSLEGCVVAGDTPPSARAAMIQLAPRFRLPSAAEDGTLVGNGRILMTYDWAALTRALDVADALRASAPTEPAPP